MEDIAIRFPIVLICGRIKAQNTSNSRERANNYINRENVAESILLLGQYGPIQRVLGSDACSHF